MVQKGKWRGRTFQITKLSFCENISVIGFKVNLIWRKFNYNSQRQCCTLNNHISFEQWTKKEVHHSYWIYCNTCDCTSTSTFTNFLKNGEVHSGATQELIGNWHRQFDIRNLRELIECRVLRALEFTFYNYVTADSCPDGLAVWCSPGMQETRVRFLIEA